MHLWVAGINHDTAAVSLRETVSLDASQIPEALDALKRRGAEEAAILSTCNRTEVYLVARSKEEAREIALGYLASNANPRQRRELVSACYGYHGEKATRHLFAVASGLDSLVLGESQILGQVREAYRLAAESGAAGPVISQLFQHAVRTGKRVRSQTGIGQGAASVSYAAVELARKIFDDLTGKNILVIGAGNMAELAAKNLVKQGSPRIWVANRTPAHSEALARAFQGTAIPFAQIGEVLVEADIVISSTAARQPILTLTTVRQAMEERHGKPLVIIDIAVPRDVEPSVHDLDGVYLYNIDDLRFAALANVAERRRYLGDARAIVREEAERFTRRMRQRIADPVIRALREKVKETADEEIERVLRRLPHLSQTDRESIEFLSHAITGKLLHDATLKLKSAAEEGGHHEVFKLVAEMFGLDVELGADGSGTVSGRAEWSNPSRKPTLRLSRGATGRRALVSSPGAALLMLPEEVSG